MTDHDDRDDLDDGFEDDVDDGFEDDVDDGFEDDVDDGFDDDVDDGFDDEVGGEGNRVVGARAREVVEHVARHLVDDPDGVFVDAQERREGVTLLIHASPGDLGRLIGRRGRVIQAIRQLGRAAGSTEGVRVTVDVAE